MVKRIVILLALAAGAVPAWARLGETEAQLTSRFGRPKSVHQTDRIAVFEKAGVTIMVHVSPANGRADWIAYERSEGDRFTTNEWQELLWLNGEDWKSDLKNSPQESREIRFNGNGKVARYLVESGVLVIAAEGANPPFPERTLKGF